MLQHKQSSFYVSSFACHSGPDGTYDIHAAVCQQYPTHLGQPKPDTNRAKRSLGGIQAGPGVDVGLCGRYVCVSVCVWGVCVCLRECCV